MVFEGQDVDNNVAGLGGFREGNTALITAVVIGWLSRGQNIALTTTVLLGGFREAKYCSQRGWQNPGVKTLENAKKNAILGKLA